ncbi:hypothetical protein JYU34_009080 [Plutella xylostella]|uniref:Ig-like domain-containing protein n=1 Tax=Plutella xylostella TaxID=51655 RepID=A0ABQ7QN42_PLUXY|nr:hypothetical protein JYU34_009080 [Plutella xylostella]
MELCPLTKLLCFVNCSRELRIPSKTTSKSSIHSTALPSEGPTITGLQSHYRTGELLSISCTSGHARPAASLAWYVNGEPASPLALMPMERIRHDDGLETSSLGLNFVLGEEHFREDVIKVKVSFGALFPNNIPRFVFIHLRRLSLPSYYCTRVFFLGKIFTYLHTF